MFFFLQFTDIREEKSICGYPQVYRRNMGWDVHSMPVFDYRTLVNVKPIVRFDAYKDNLDCNIEVGSTMH